jgi:hypothetical protein
MNLHVCVARVRYLLYRTYHRDITPIIRKLIPHWLMVQVLIKAATLGKGIADDECVPDVPFMVVYSRWYDRKFPGHSSAVSSQAPVEES